MNDHFLPELAWVILTHGWQPLVVGVEVSLFLGWAPCLGLLGLVRVLFRFDRPRPTPPPGSPSSPGETAGSLAVNS